MMKEITNRALYRVLDRTLPGWRDTGGWTYNMFSGTPHLRLSERVGMKRILAATRVAIGSLAETNEPLILFHDGAAAWRNKHKRSRAYRFATYTELERFALRQMHFRNPRGFIDNYNIIDETGGWMITFCHEDDWFLFAHRTELDFLKQKIKAEQGGGEVREPRGGSHAPHP